VLAPAPRADELDAQLVEVVPPVGRVARCLVDADPDRVEAVSELLLSWFDTTQRPGVYPLLDEELGRTPERELAGRSSRRLWVAAAALLGLWSVGDWFGRRQELGLYRLLGLSRARIAAVLAVEALVGVLLPVAIGASVAIVRQAARLRSPLVAGLVGDDLAAAAIVLVLVPAVATVLFALRRPFDDLKGA
jgi:hypothetical protein